MKRNQRNTKELLALPEIRRGIKQKTKAKPILTQRKSLLSTFEREYLDLLQRREQPKARIKFLSSEATPHLTDIDYTPESAHSPSIALRKRFSLLKSPDQSTFTSSSSQEIRVPRFKDYYKSISQSKKLFDATNFEEKQEGYTSI